MGEFWIFTSYGGDLVLGRFRDSETGLTPGRQSLAMGMWDGRETLTDEVLVIPIYIYFEDQKQLKILSIHIFLVLSRSLSSPAIVH